MIPAFLERVGRTQLRNLVSRRKERRAGSAAGLPPAASHRSGRAQLRHPARPVADSHALRYPWSSRGQLIEVRCPRAVARPRPRDEAPPSLPRVLAARVPRLQRCRVGGGALGCPHAALRPPLKRRVRFSRTPLSQRHATSVGGSKESVRSSVQGPTPRRDDAPAAVSSPGTATA